MKFSVIVPVYNTEKFLPKCIESILLQDYSDFELLLVVDGATDNSLSVCQQYAMRDDRIKVFNKPNGGSTSCRKVAANIASGDYVICIDSDDYIDEGYFLYAANIIEEYRVDIISFGMITHFNDASTKSYDFVSQGLYLGKDYERIKKGFIYDKKKRGFNYGTLNYSLCRKIIKKEIFTISQNAVNDKLVMGEDMFCSAHVLQNSESLYVSDKCFYNYRTNSNSITRHNIAKNFNHFNNTVIEMKKSGIIDNDRIIMYAYKVVSSSITAMAKELPSYQEFITELNDAFQCEELFDMMCKIRWFDGNLKEKALALLIKNGKYRWIYYIYNKK